jgi:hypothetical protein
MTEHYPRPSTAHRWIGAGCTGSIRLSQGYPDTAGPWAEEGTRLHELAAQWLRAEFNTYEHPMPDLADEDREIIEPYVRDVLAYAWRPTYIEQEVSHVFGGHLLKGTPDAYVVTDKEIVVWDLKTGWSLVEAQENWQLICYAAMLQTHPPKDIHLRIVQPRPYHPDGRVRSWRISGTQFLKYRYRIAKALKDVYERERLRVGPSCRYCPAIASCPAIRDVTLRDVDYTGTSDEVHLPDTEIARELAQLRAARDRMSLRVAALEETIAARIKGGTSIRGATLTERRGRLAWRYDDDEVLAALSILTGIDHAKRVPPTPQQLLKAGLSEQLIATLAARKPGKLVVDTNPADKARKAFGD